PAGRCDTPHLVSTYSSSSPRCLGQTQTGRKQTEIGPTDKIEDLHIKNPKNLAYNNLLLYFYKVIFYQPKLNLP
ncbi:hypothetical protein, partial [Alistipes communis]|uniref:hypothetical protein n=1 Tax=Alistipes communis TaxID=2585118 RepID=UPI003AF4D73C